MISWDFTIMLYWPGISLVLSVGSKYASPVLAWTPTDRMPFHIIMFLMISPCPAFSRMTPGHNYVGEIDCRLYKLFVYMYHLYVHLCLFYVKASKTTALWSTSFIRIMARWRRYMPRGTWSALVQAGAWGLSAPSHYLNQCWFADYRTLGNIFQ